MTRLEHFWVRLLGSELMSWAVVLVGVALRASQYLLNPSLRMDEAALSLNLLGRDWGQLLAPLDYNQAAPLGFLYLEKAAISLFGDSEYGLRLVPSLAGAVSVPLFCLLVRRWENRGAALVSLTLFAFSFTLIRWSREVKQYSLDVLVVLALLLVLGCRSPARWTGLWTAAVSIAAGAAVFLSHPAVFILGAVSVLEGLAIGLRRQWRALGLVGVFTAVWGGAFLVHWKIAVREIATRGEMLEYWSSAMVPLPPTTLEDLRSLFSKFVEVMEASGGFPAPALAALPVAVGAVTLFSRKPSYLCLLGGPGAVRPWRGSTAQVPLYGSFPALLGSGGAIAGGSRRRSHGRAREECPRPWTASGPVGSGTRGVVERAVLAGSHPL